MPPAIVCQQLYKQYPGRPPVDAVNGIDLVVNRGECFGLLGPNGAGKTTTIEILEGLLKPSSGKVEVLGHEWGRGDDKIKQQIGISLQETRLPEKLTVRESIQLFRSFYHRGYPVDDVMRQVGLEEKARTWVRKLSGGQKQRLAVACALVGAPDLLFLDEPTTGLDPQSRRQLWSIIRRLRDDGRSVMLTTHYMDEAQRLCDRVAIVDQGRVIAEGSPQELIERLGGEHIVELAWDGAADDDPANDPFNELPTVTHVRREAGRVELTVGQPHIVLPLLLERFTQSQRKLTSLTTRHASLEDVFVSLTGRHLDDAEALQTATAS